MAASDFTNGLRRLEQSVHVLGCESGGECQDHDGAAEQADFAHDAALVQLEGKRFESTKNRLPGWGPSWMWDPMLVPRSCDYGRQNRSFNR